jgi:hypothetical protein
MLGVQTRILYYFELILNKLFKKVGQQVYKVLTGTIIQKQMLYVIHDQQYSKKNYPSHETSYLSLTFKMIVFINMIKF